MNIIDITSKVVFTKNDILPLFETPQLVDTGWKWRSRIISLHAFEGICMQSWI